MESKNAEQIRKTVYILQITKNKLTHESFKLLKTLLNHIIRTTNVKHVVLEAFFTEDDFHMEESFTDMLEIIVNAYNLMEPEHSMEFPLVKLDILLPQLFKTRSLVLTDGDVREIYFNPETDMTLINTLIQERQASQAMPPLEVICPIDKIQRPATVMAVELDFGQLNLFDKPKENPFKNASDLFKYKQACLGGTFDHMHSGHKLLLMQASLLTKDVLHVGVTGDALLGKKAYASYLEPFETRKQNVINFVSILDPFMKINIFELSDPVGLAGTVSEIEACILTREVEKGGAMINAKRQENGLSPVDLVFVNMILADHNQAEANYSNKLSSTHIRKYLATEQTKQ